ncbi:MAG: Bcr/CflA family drug resistance efflux transporter [Polaromonas sp. 39-63-203]|jgi:DHA1 family bicyclomycin/chloramphenicol resistance-like MFS transporter|uniref:multidrug effflux MFS transporter n=1 Tax=Polaromonas sp. TaxID=1869339 RepID=UPI000BD45938|nr:multidrug effflux MFS transporter [Polaromonas sp.]OYY51888.1 MAG: Bcr/CflA family drug resistance efflux transporter [Polaromonas sp. 35-63-240]OYZ84359.1 MAG: Bcr/CflA family drug resistance efflux transporter [Polaromonas sp. 24-62-144]OZA99752.1 MAG: Bcr/CflA family drug resistance efflux transporter [Polaromonas sp. 39-63-203]HQS32185.1 multidrug effflux MFS transporter [Polaromonas sp.]HQS92483.1 multidrug effflux MFS transporter [Polaromonas sp.]
MNPNADQLWHGPRWTLAVLLAVLGMLGPFSIDTYIPAFAGIGSSLGATPVEMQQTLSAYLFGFAFMNLFHGALADSFGRRPVVLWGIAMFTLASAGCALSQSVEQLVFFRALQGLSTGAGIVVSRAVIRDMYPPAQAQQVMSQVTIYFGVAPALAPIVGGWLFVHLGWHSIFWFLTAIGGVLWVTNFRFLPETLAVEARQPFEVKHLMRGYWQLGSSPRFLLLALASGVPFNGMFLYVLSAPAFLGDLLHLQPTQFFWFFVLTISGIMSGAWLSGRLAGKIAPKQQIRHGFVIMLSVSVINLATNLLFPAHVAWALFPIALFAFGWALMVPVVTLLVLDLHPERRGMASSLQAFIGSSANGIVAGVIAPLVMHSAPALAAASLGMMCIGLLAWVYLHHRWPEIGRSVASD